MKRIICFLPLPLIVTACGRKSEAPPEAAAIRNMAQAPLPASPSLSPKDLITDDKIARYVIYQKEVNTVVGLAVGAATGAFQKSGGNQKGFEKELSRDERIKKIADTQASALARSGLTQPEATEIGKIVSTYTPGATMGDAEMKKQSRAEFSAKYGPEVLTVLEKHLPELEKVQDEMMSAVLGKKK